ncbi:MAG: ribonuclease E activity regulator RraA [Parvibaculum sedimenti]|uniref:ribonuclease E activity regulator RraA n=1 Tax=Parvibaculum sedimenti TaxID=2608632 RepID=UPI003BB5F124
MTSPATTDLSDAHPDIQHAEPIFRDFGGKLAFSGPITTFKTFEDNPKLRQALEGPGNGRVLVVDGGGSLRCALFGGNLAVFAAKNGWAGLVINGCVRDTAEIAAQPVGVKALAAHPKRSDRKGLGEYDVVVSFAGVTFRPGEYLYADADGIVVSAQKID